MPITAILSGIASALTFWKNNKKEIEEVKEIFEDEDEEYPDEKTEKRIYDLQTELEKEQVKQLAEKIFVEIQDFRTGDVNTEYCYKEAVKYINESQDCLNRIEKDENGVWNWK